jgi:hypothetical protein
VHGYSADWPPAPPPPGSGPLIWPTIAQDRLSRIIAAPVGRQPKAGPGPSWRLANRFSARPEPPEDITECIEESLYKLVLGDFHVTSHLGLTVTRWEICAS